jgi:putative nucleotidyltransferase with HDIG domain
MSWVSHFMPGQATLLVEPRSIENSHRADFDQWTLNHTLRVMEYSVLLAQQLKVTDAERELLQLGAHLHDIGKVGIPEDILNKTGPLTPNEFEIMKRHTIIGEEIVSAIPGLEAICPIIRSHHERWDGTGYPDRLGGDEIPWLARIVAVADAFDAMTSDRPYRKGMSAHLAFEEIAWELGHQFDPDCAWAMLQMRQSIISEMRRQRPRSATVVAWSPDHATETDRRSPFLD